MQPQRRSHIVVAADECLVRELEEELGIRAHHPFPTIAH